MTDPLPVGYGRFDAYRTESHELVSRANFSNSVHAKGDLERFAEWMEKREVPHPALKDFLKSEWAEFRRETARAR